MECRKREGASLVACGPLDEDFLREFAAGLSRFLEKKEVLPHPAFPARTRGESEPLDFSSQNMRYAITTFGCQMNVHDSERMHGVLRGAGLSPAEGPAEADVVVLNTCSVREKAEQKLRSELGRLAKLKRERPEMLVVVAGCVAQQEGEKLLKAARGVDLVVGPDSRSSGMARRRSRGRCSISRRPAS